MRVSVVLIILAVVIVSFCSGANLRRVFRSKRAESDFILRSCIASAQLTRKHRTNGATNLAADSSEFPKLSAQSLVLDSSKFKSYHGNKRARSDSRLRTRSKGRNLVEKITTDTPLGTVDVKALRKDVPKLFKKKDPLPELDRHGSARNIDTDAPIIIVHNLNQ